MDLKAADRYNQQTSGEEPTKATVWYDVRVLRVGKANTLLVAPRDWSTLSNGTVDGTPSGLHRYVGENRFVFALLNVTDGQGNVASYDLETKESTGMYTDASSNAIHACPEGSVTNATGYFGSGVSLSGSGTDLYTCTSGATTKLNAIYQSMTVPLWIKTDVDYVASGTGWAWTFGRKDLWRVGFDLSVPGLRFSVNDPTAGWRSAAAVFPLYTGRWLHVAAVLANGQDGQFRWSNLSLYVNGERIAYQSFTSVTSVRTGSTFLYLGWDEASGTSAGRYKGALDEFRLYSTALNQSAVRGLLWFLHGANNLLIPRGIFYDSKLYGGLNGSYSASAPLAGATAYGNLNSLSSNLNSRVIQMVIAKNLTLAQAWGILDLARRQNGTSNVTSFPFFAASEFHTLGFSWEVSKLASNTSVANGGNWSVAPPPPPTNLWALFWNTIAGFATYVWNAVVAVGAFFVNVGKWLISATVGYVVGLVSAAWNNFKNQVLKPLIDALSKLIQWIIDMVSAAVSNALNAVIAPIRERFSLLAGGLGRLALSSRGSYDPVTQGALWTTGNLASPEFSASLLAVLTILLDIAAFISILKLVITALEIGLGIAQVTGVGLIVSLAVQVVIIAMFTLLSPILQPIADFIANALNPAMQALSWIAAVIALIITALSFIGPRHYVGVKTFTTVINDFPQYRWINDLIEAKNMGKTIKPVETAERYKVTDELPGSGAAVIYALLSLTITSATLVLVKQLDQKLRPAAAILLDIFAIVVAVASVFDAFRAPAIATLGTAAKVISVAALGIGIAAFTTDLVTLQSEANP